MTRRKEDEFIFNIPKGGLADESAPVPGDYFIAMADIYENDDFIFLDIEVPGVSLDDISITLKNDRLTIVGNKVEKLPDQEVSFYCAERAFGRFKRVFDLGYTINPSKIAAKMGNGILHVSIPKVKEKRKRVHKVQVSLDE